METSRARNRPDEPLMPIMYVADHEQFAEELDAEPVKFMDDKIAEIIYGLGHSHYDL